MFSKGSCQIKKIKFLLSKIYNNKFT